MVSGQAVSWKILGLEPLTGCCSSHPLLCPTGVFTRGGPWHHPLTLCLRDSSSSFMPWARSQGETAVCHLLFLHWGLFTFPVGSISLFGSFLGPRELPPSLFSSLGCYTTVSGFWISERLICCCLLLLFSCLCKCHLHFLAHSSICPFW